MKRMIMNLLLAVLTAGTAFASIEWGDSRSVETYDFEKDGLYYGIISEKRAEVQVMNKNAITEDPYPYGFELTEWPVYRYRTDDLNYEWPGGYYEGDVEIPQTVVHEGKSYTVVRIAFGAFAWCDGLTSIKLPSTLKEIRFGAFSMCTSLREITLPPNTAVCGGAFFGCSSLKSLDLSDCRLFYHDQYDRVICQCTSLEEVYMPALAPMKDPYVECVGENGSHQEYGQYYFSYDDCPFAPVADEEGTYAAINQAPELYSDSYVSEQYSDSYLTNVNEFMGCTSLRVIHMTAPEPYDDEAVRNMFRELKDLELLYENCTLYVPEGSLEAYKAVEPWSNFRNIVEEKPLSAIEGIESGIVPETESMSRIYDLSGVLRQTLVPGESPNLAPGLYIERTASDVRKFHIR